MAQGAFQGERHMNRRTFFLGSLAAIYSMLIFATNVLAQQQVETIRAAHMLDGRGNARNNVLITVQNGLITGVESAAPGTKATNEFDSLTLLPGLIDTHAHPMWYFNREGRYHLGRDGETRADAAQAAEANAYATLLGGITTIQSPGAPEDKTLRERITAGIVPGPRILTSLRPIDDPRSTPEQLREIVR